MTDIAELGLSINSTPAVKAAEALDQLAKSAEKVDKGVKGVNDATEEAGRTFRKVGSAIAVLDGPLGGVASRFRSFGTLIGQTGLALGALAVAFAGVTLAARRVFSDYIRETVEAEYASMRLNAVLKSTGGVSGMTRESLDELAKSLRSVTGFSDNSIKSAQGLLLQFTNIGRSIFPQATEAALDMASALGTDAASAARQIGRALQDPIRGVQSLSEAGVQFTQSQKLMIASMVRSGAGAKAQELILKQLEERFGGTARAAQNTLGGASSDLSNAWKELLKVVGPAAVALRESIQRLADALGSEKFRTFANQVGSLLFNAITAAVDALTALVGILPTATKLLLTFGAAWAAVAAPGVILASASAIATWAAGTTVAVTTLSMAFRVFAATGLALVVGGLQAVLLGLRAVAVAVAANPLGALVTVAVAGYVAFQNWHDEMLDMAATASRVFGDIGSTARNAANVIIGSFNFAFENIKTTLKLLDPREWSKGGPSFSDQIVGNARNTLGRDYIGELQRQNEANQVGNRAGAMSGGLSGALTGRGNGMDGANNFNTGGDNAYDRAIKQSRERTAQLRAEIETIGKSVAEQQRYMAAIALETAAKESGMAVTKELKAQIDAEASAYANAAAQLQYKQAIQASNDNFRALNQEINLIGKYGYELAFATEQYRLLEAARQSGQEVLPWVQAEIDARAHLRASQETYLELMRETERTTQRAFSGFLQDIASGTSALDALSNALRNIGNQLIEMGTQKLVAQAFGGLNEIGRGSGGGGGLLSALFGGGFSRGGYTGNGPTNVPAGIVHGQEFVVNADATKAYGPLLEAMNSGRGIANGNAPASPPRSAQMAPAPRQPVNQTSVTVAPVFNVSGGDGEKTVAQMKQELLPQIERIAKKATVDLLERSARYAGRI